MKKPLLLLFLFFIFFSLFLSALTPLKLVTDKNTYLAGDSLYKYQVEYKDPGSTGRELEWDFSHLQIQNENYLIRYFRSDTVDSANVCGMEHRTRYYYRQRQDSVWATGFENYTTRMSYITPELKMRFPFSYGDTLFSLFEGEGMYSNMLPLRVKGYTRVKADAEGALKLPEKTISNALRVHTTRQYTETGKDSLQMTLDTYSWYVKDVRYPVFESIRTSIRRICPAKQGEEPSDQANDTTVFRTSFYYLPEELNTNSGVSDFADIYGNPVPEAETVFTEASMLPNPVISNLNISYKLTRRATIWFSIHNNIGQPMTRTSQQTLDEGWHYETINMTSLYKGTYTVYVHVDDMVISRVVVKK
ncbi:MAG: T9SS type A sorting domain-containing protein [Paludibacteraceae bacterium]